MNYIWDVLLQADKQNIPRKKVKLELAKCYSPYMEISFEDLNTVFLNEEDVTIEVNPYYRFYSLFKDLFHPDFIESLDLRETLLDILLHYLGNIDLKQGFCKREYYMKFIEKDLLNGVYGKNITENFESFSSSERVIILGSILALYKTGTSYFNFKKVIKKIFTKSYIYQNQSSKNQLLIYLGEKKNEQNIKKLQFINEFFLPLHAHICVYWEYHFCIMGIEETAILEKIALY